MAQSTQKLREIINARRSEASAELEKAGKLTAANMQGDKKTGAVE